MKRLKLTIAAILALSCQGSPPDEPPEVAPQQQAAARPITAADVQAVKMDVAHQLGEGREPRGYKMANGTDVLELPGNGSVVLARRSDDGKLETSCVDSSAGAEEFLKAPPVVEEK